jgi:hypothetical protein
MLLNKFYIIIVVNREYKPSRPLRRKKILLKTLWIAYNFKSELNRSDKLTIRDGKTKGVISKSMF